MFRHIGFALSLALLVALPAAAQDFQKGAAAYKRGDYATALNEWRALAETGDALSQFMVGALYAFGRGVEKDYAEAAKWYRKAAEQGLPAAQNNLGSLYDKGQSVSQDYVEAAKWYRKAAEQGYAQAQNNLGVMYGDGRGVPQNYAEALKWFAKAALQGNLQAKRNIELLKAKRREVEEEEPPPEESLRQPSGVASAAEASTLPTEEAAVPRESGSAEPTRLVPRQPPEGPAVPVGSGTAGPDNENAPRDSETANVNIAEAAPAPAGKRFHVQLSSIRSDDRAVGERAAARLTRTHRSILGDLEVVAIRADLGERGIYYRLRAGPLADYTSAAELCRELTAREQDCIVVRQ